MSVLIETSLGDIVVDLLVEHAPRACENFRQLCTGEFRREAGAPPLGYKGVPVHKIIPGALIQTGDFVFGDGRGCDSIYGPNFRDEGDPRDWLFPVAGLVGMANRGAPNTNGCQFVITLGPSPQLDGKNVLIGRVVDGMSVIRAIEFAPLKPNSALPKLAITISQCGEM
jgi:peptidyl-prolyl isomerase H (cyclophilin H)